MNKHRELIRLTIMGFNLSLEETPLAAGMPFFEYWFQMVDGVLKPVYPANGVTLAGMLYAFSYQTLFGASNIPELAAQAGVMNALEYMAAFTSSVQDAINLLQYPPEHPDHSEPLTVYVVFEFERHPVEGGYRLQCEYLGTVDLFTEIMGWTFVGEVNNV